MKDYLSGHGDPTMVGAVQQFIESKLMSTGRRGIDRVVDFIRASNFYAVGCCRHHRFAGGMSQHAIETYLYASAHNTLHIPESSLIITCLLHDICDISGYSRYTRHGNRSKRLIEVECGFELTQSESDAILHHMHSRHEPKKFGRDYERVTADPLWNMIRSADHYSADHPLNRYQLYKQITGNEYQRTHTPPRG